jgi:hypothetical protein
MTHSKTPKLHAGVLILRQLSNALTVSGCLTGHPGKKPEISSGTVRGTTEYPMTIPLHTGLAGFNAQLAMHWRSLARWEATMRTRFGANHDTASSIRSQSRSEQLERECWAVVREIGGAR